MKVALITPNFHEIRGNTITVQRIAEGLEKKGIETEIISITKEQNTPKLPKVDIVHGFNAFQFYSYWEKQGASDIPYIVTLTGTDLNHDLFDNERAKIVKTSLAEAKAVHVFNKEARTKLLGQVPSSESKLHLIPQGVVPFSQRNRKSFLKEDNTILFVLPAGIRKVKNVPFAITKLASVYEQNKKVRLWIIGPILEEEEGLKVKELVDQHKEWVRYLGPLDHDQMGGIYANADIALNTSISEGQSGALLEAMVEGVPVLVSDNTGNRDIVSHGKVGLIYQDETEFLTYARKLIENVELRGEMGKSGKEYINKFHSVQKEVEDIKRIYDHVLHSG